MVRNDLTPNLPVPSEKQSIQATLVYFQLLFSHHQPPLAFQPWLFSLQSSLTVLPVRWHRKLLETTPANSPKQLTTSWWEQNAHIRTPMEHHVGAILVQHTDEPRQKISKLLSCISKFAFTNWFENKFHYVCIVPKMCRKAPQSVDSLCLLREPWQFPASSLPRLQEEARWVLWERVHGRSIHYHGTSAICSQALGTVIQLQGPAQKGVQVGEGFYRIVSGSPTRRIPLVSILIGDCSSPWQRYHNLLLQVGEKSRIPESEGSTVLPHFEKG